MKNIKNKLKIAAIGIGIVLAGAGFYKLGLEKGKNIGKENAINNIEACLIQEAKENFDEVALYADIDSFNIMQEESKSKFDEYCDFLGNAYHVSNKGGENMFIGYLAHEGSIKYNLAESLELCAEE